VSVSIDERTFMELYLPPFQGAVDGEVGSIMCSYNLINGTHACSNNGTLNRFLKDEAGFDGFVMSDWNGAHRPYAIVNGLDTEMPGLNQLNNNTIHTLLSNGSLTEARLDDAATRVVTALYRVGAMDKKNTVGNLSANVTTDYSRAAAQGVAEDSAVLLKNNGVLPIKKGQKVVLAGTNAPSFGGWGSGSVAPSYAPGWGAEMGARQDPPVTRMPFLHNADTSDEGIMKQINEADVIVVVVVTRSGEGADRQNITFSAACPHNWCNVAQDAIVENITRVAGKKTVVIGLSTGTVLTPWADAAGAVVLDWMPGQYYAPALTRLLYGDVTFSGKLPVTIPNKVNEEGWTEEQYPGVYIPPCTPRSRNCGPVVTYSEGLFVGYRWYDKHGVAPKFPFGHGISYTTFGYKGLRMQKSGDGAMVWATVSNSGAQYAGREVAQLYLTFPGNDPFEPKSLLKAFNKTALLQPGQSVELSFTLSERDLSFWLGGRWVKQTGEYKIAVGSSSRDLRLTGSLTI